MNYAVILSAGAGNRAKMSMPKQFIKIKNKTILEYTIDAFEKNEETERIILVVHPKYIDFCKNFNYTKIHKIVEGGKTRQESSYNGVFEIEEDDAKVLIHDGARPFLKNELIKRCYKALDFYDAVNVGIETSDTIIKVDDKNFITDIPDRKTLLRCQTPQGFKSGLIKKAHKLALEKNICATDDTGLILSCNLSKIKVVEGDIKNIKITYPDDIELARKKLG